MATKSNTLPGLYESKAVGGSSQDSGKAWFVDLERASNIIALVNARGSCSARIFSASGRPVKLIRDHCTNTIYQVRFGNDLKSMLRVVVSKQPNLEAAMAEGLPQYVVDEINGQVKEHVRQTRKASKPTVTEPTVTEPTV